MRGEFLGVWSETWREIWQPLITEPHPEDSDGLPEDIFCELYRALRGALRKPTGDAAINLLLGDAIALRAAFDRAAQRSGKAVVREAVEKALENSGAEEVQAPAQRRALLVAALSGLLRKPAAPLLDAVLQEHGRDSEKVEAAWNRATERTLNDPVASREAFKFARLEDFTGERALVGFFEAVHDILEDFEAPGDDALTNRYFNLLFEFIEKFSLRYDLRRPCILCPTLPGLFASLVRDLRALTGSDPHLDALMKDFESAVRDLRHDSSDGRIKTCIQKQVNLVEALGRNAPGVTGNTLGRICDQVGTWPHEKLKVAMKELYGFTSDYPGIRHGGTSASALRAVDMRDMVAVTILLTGFTPYLESRLSADSIFGGGIDSAGPVRSGLALAVENIAAPVAMPRAGGLLSRLAFWRKVR